MVPAFEPNDHYTTMVPEYIPDPDRPCILEQQLRVLVKDCQCLDGGACTSANLVHDMNKNLFTDVTSCADMIVSSVDDSKDIVRLALDAMGTLRGFNGQVLEEHPHSVLSMIQMIARIPRKTSTSMSIRSDPKLSILPAMLTHGAWHGVAALEVCEQCVRMLREFWWSWALKRGSKDRWKVKPLVPNYDDQELLPCGTGHAWAIQMMTRTGSLSDGIFGDNHCSHMALACRSGLFANTLGRYMTVVLLQAAAQIGGMAGNHAGGWGGARILNTVLPVWDELWDALTADGESTVAIASASVYSLGSDYAKEVQCSTQEDDTMRFVMYAPDEEGKTTSSPPAVLHDASVRLESMQEYGQPEWSMTLLKMWRDCTLKHWPNVGTDGCFDRYVRAYLNKDGDQTPSKSTCNRDGVNWSDVRSWHYENPGARAGASEILTRREV
ncbi:hypothetical protein EC968_004630 [Mortierella alpina]|nr:hypothetical protein EC968_004630 [Mortierella alpina]